MLGAARIAGVGLTPLAQGGPPPTGGAVGLMLQALHAALADANTGAAAPAPAAATAAAASRSSDHSTGIGLSDLDGIIGLPALMGPSFMAGHAVATAAGLLGPGRRRPLVVRTLDVGGAGPVAALLMAARMVSHESLSAVAVVAGDTPGSAALEDFLARANAAAIGGGSSDCSSSGGGRGAGEGGSSSSGEGPSHRAASPIVPLIPGLYDKIAQWQMKRYCVTREQLAMVASLMTAQAVRHPLSLRRHPRSVAEVLASPPVAPVTTVLECAKRADGAAAVLVVSPEFAAKRGLPASRCVAILGGGEAAGPAVPPAEIEDGTYSAAAEAAAAAYRAAGLGGAADVDYFSIYDCFPVAFIRGLEAVGLAPEGQGGAFVEKAYLAATAAAAAASHSQNSSSSSDGRALPVTAPPPNVFPCNTHGGLLGLGAPWEVPAMHGVAEAVAQLRGEATGRQVQGTRRALVYGNGGVLSAAAVAVLGAPAGGAGRPVSRL